MAVPKDVRDARTAGNQAGANDLATFGASPAAFAAFAPAAFGTTPASAAPTAFRVSEAGTGASDDDGPAHTSGTPPGDGGGATPGGTADIAPLPVVAPAGPPASEAPDSTTGHAPANADGGIGPFVPMPQGSGAVAQPTPPPLSAPDGSDTAPATAVGPAAAIATVPADAHPASVSLDTAMTSIAALQDAVAALAGSLPGTATTDESIASIGSAIDQITTTVGQAQAAATATLADMTHLVAQVGGDVATSVASLTDGVAGSVAALTDTIAVPAVADTLGTVTTTVAALPDAVSTVGDILDAAGDGLAGADPVAGITTLVSMVSAADAFNLHDAGSSATDMLAPALGSLGAVDLLADVVPADTLLGIDDDHHAGVLGGIHLDDGLHGLGL